MLKSYLYCFKFILIVSLLTGSLYGQLATNLDGYDPKHFKFKLSDRAGDLVVRWPLNEKHWGKAIIQLKRGKAMFGELSTSDSENGEYSKIASIPLYYQLHA